MANKTAVASTKKDAAIKAIVKDTNLGVIDRIIRLRKKKLTQKQIIDLGFNKNTVYRQVREYEMN